MIAENDYIVVDGVPFRPELLELMFAEDDLGKTTDPTLLQFMRDEITPWVRRKHPDSGPRLRFVTGHVHVGTRGVTKHDHLPYRFTSILYMTDAQGPLVLDPDGEALEILPREGRLVIMRAALVHSVKMSPVPELRAALVSNYANEGDIHAIRTMMTRGDSTDGHH